MWLWTSATPTSGATVGQRDLLACLKGNLDAGGTRREYRVQVEKGNVVYMEFSYIYMTCSLL